MAGKKKNIKTRVGVLGAGKMGEALICGIRKSESSSSYKLSVLSKSKKRSQEITKELGITTTEDIKKFSTSTDVIILCVKPKDAKSSVKSIAPFLKKSQLLISVCAGISNKDLLEWAENKCHVIRTMPNTPCLIGEGMTVLSPAPPTPDASVKTADSIFKCVGKTATLDESLMDGVTGLSGCGPAYTYLVIEALSEAGVKVGIPRKISTLLVTQTMLGAAKMLLERDHHHPAALKDEVTTPAGCTIDGLMALEEGNVRIAFIKAVVAATERSKNLK